MYIYHALINALSTHMIRINLNMILYTHVEHSSTQTTHTKHYIKRQTPLPLPMNKNHNSNVYDTDLYHTSYMCTRAHACMHAHVHTVTVAETGY